MARILVIDDDEMICEALCTIGTRMGHEDAYALTLREGLAKATAEAFDLVFLDVRLPDGNGLEILPAIRETPSAPEVVIITGTGDPDGAELAIKNGAWDYIHKPLTAEAIRLPMVRALEFRKHKLAERSEATLPPGVMALKREGIVGNSPSMRACLDGVAQAASSTASVLLTGETGTGKELFARAIHDNSCRNGKPFVVVDCAVLTESLVESVLFGHEKGAFTGADRARAGMMKLAHGGTLFLDEIGELPLSVQKAFLRVLQEHRFRPLGGSGEVYSDFRLIAATNRNLEEMVQDSQFRKDLFFRIRSLSIELPPLRERVEDIKELVSYHLNILCERDGRGTKGLSPEFLKALCCYGWPGNVRELVHAMEAVLSAAKSEPVLFPDHLPVHIRIQVARTTASRTISASPRRETLHGRPERPPTLQEAREAAITGVEKDYLQRLTSLSRTDPKECCRIAGISRSQLYALLKKHAISPHVPAELPSLQEARDTAVTQVEKDYLQRLMTLPGTDLEECCRIAGLSRSQLYTLLKKHAIKRGS